MWQASTLKRMMDEGHFPPRRPNGDKLSFILTDDDSLVRIPAYIVVDAAFSYSAHCIKPFRNNMPRASSQYLFNKIHSKSRQFIEQTWAMLVNRFRRWKSPLEIHGRNWEKRVTNMILASMIVHNICIDNSDFASDRNYANQNVDERMFDDEQWGEFVSEGLQVRDYLSAIINSEWKMNLSEDVAVRR